jgi:hypothetical protein
MKNFNNITATLELLAPAIKHQSDSNLLKQYTEDLFFIVATLAQHSNISMQEFQTMALTSYLEASNNPSQNDSYESKN